MGALALTGQPAKRVPFEPMPAGVEFVPYGDIPALRAAVDDTVAAVFLEPILGEAGVVPAPDGYLAAARAITAEHGTLLVIDEVQTGIGRTGSWFAHTRSGIVPDVITLAKGLGGGLPIGAAIGIGDAAHLLQPGQHGSTFAGNPVCAAAALAVLRHHRDRRSARPCRRTGQAHRHRRRGSRPSADRPRPRCRPAAGHRADRERRLRQRLSPPARPASSSTRRPRTCSGWRRR